MQCPSTKPPGTPGTPGPLGPPSPFSSPVRLIVATCPSVGVSYRMAPHTGWLADCFDSCSGPGRIWLGGSVSPVPSAV